MTSIVAKTDGRTVVVGGDSAGVRGDDMRLQAGPKVFRTGDYAVGFTTSFRMGQILRYCVELPEPPANASPDDLERFLVLEVVPLLQRTFAENGFGKTVRWSSSRFPGVTEEGQAVGGLFVLGVAGQIFEIREDFQVARPAASYTAVGGGAQVALGALHALDGLDMPLREQVELALAASEAYVTGVRRPFCVVEMGPSD